MPRPNTCFNCTLWFCDEPHYGRGLCARHYQNWLRSGNPLPKQNKDLKVVLRVLDNFRDATFKLLAPKYVYEAIETEDGVGLRCRYCGKVTQREWLFEEFRRREEEEKQSQDEKPLGLGIVPPPMFTLDELYQHRKNCPVAELHRMLRQTYTPSFTHEQPYELNLEIQPDDR